MALVGSFHSRQHAEMAAAMLEGHGVRAAVAGDDAGGVAPHWTFGTSGGYAVTVPDAERDLAVELLGGDDGTSVPEPTTLRRLALHAAILLGLLGAAAGWLEATL